MLVKGICLFRPVAPGDRRHSGLCSTRRIALRGILLKRGLSTNTPSVGALTPQHGLPVPGSDGPHSRHSPRAAAVGMLTWC